MRTLRLAPEHDRAGFISGVEPLDRYFREQAGQDARRRVSACSVAVEAATRRIAGFYTLSAGSIPLAEVPEPLAKRLPRYAPVPVVWPSIFRPSWMKTLTHPAYPASELPTRKLATLAIERDEFHGEWNYRLLPRDGHA